jgi:hypothetical protein
MGLIYPERNALFWLTILILCLQRANSKSTPIYFLACFVATHFLLYYKEFPWACGPPEPMKVERKTFAMENGATCKK